MSLYTMFLTVILSASAYAQDSFPRKCRIFNDVVASGSLTSSIENYQVIRQDCGQYVATRTMSYQNRNFKLVVNKDTVQTAIVHEDCVQCKTEYMDLRESSAFETAILRHTEAPYTLANHGLKSYQNSGEGQVVSVDLCPSSRRFERPLFEKMIAQLPNKPIPVTLAVTHLWMKKYSEDLEWLKEQYLNGNLLITWMNHSVTHPYKQGAPLEKNFLLTPGVDFDQEVLGNEISMIQFGLVPSVFFRFPGLISSEALILRLRDFSLVPVGSLAWLAKGEKVDLRSLILIHGNGNEPLGIFKMMRLIDQNVIYPRALEPYSIFQP